MMEVGLAHYLVVASAVFALGLLTAMTRRPPGPILGAAIATCGAALALVAFDHFLPDARGDGARLALVALALTGAQAALALAIARRRPRADASDRP